MLDRRAGGLAGRRCAAGAGGKLSERGELTARGHVILGTDDQADPLVTERGQVSEGLSAAVSSVATQGKSRLSIAALNSTTGMPRLRSSR